ncbi:MAG: stage II sporulation protein P, partial [Acetanaerobacterium sp.]
MRRRFDIFRYVPPVLALVVLGAGFFTVYKAVRLDGSLSDRILALSAGVALPDGSLSLFYGDNEVSDDEVYLPDIVSDPIDEDREPVENAAELTSSVNTVQSASSVAAAAAIQPPPANAGTIVRENLNLANPEGSYYLAYQNGVIKNSTKLSGAKVTEYMDADIAFRIYKNKKPQVLIVHTHATEAFESNTEYFDKSYNSRSQNNSENIVSVGAVIATQLEDAGIATLHDGTQHDYPSYNGSYNGSADTINDYLKKYPTIKVVLDIHRDAVERDGSRLSAVTQVDGKDAAQVMIISGCDDGTMDYPSWKSNLRFAARLQNEMETLYPGLTRPVMFCYRRYNQHLSTGALLLEIGSHGN